MNQNKRQNDNRSTRIKQILRQHYPLSTHRVRIEKYSGGECIYIKTSALNPPEYQIYNQLNDKLRSEGLNEEENTLYEATKKQNERYNEKQDSIKKLLNEFWHVDRDDQGEILAGGNSYIDVESLEVYP